jgi:hypothetical protein
MTRIDLLSYLRERKEGFISLAMTASRALICTEELAPGIVVTQDADGSLLIYFCTERYRICNAAAEDVSIDYGGLPSATGVIERIRSTEQEYAHTMLAVSAIARQILEDTMEAPVEWHDSPIKLELP